MAASSIKILLAAVMIQCAIANVYIADISATETDSTDGTLNNPFPSITSCVNALRNPGDECQIREGTYREVVTLDGLRGTEENPIVIRGYMDERPTLDGTVDIEPISGSWEKNGQIYSGKITETIWQLFIDDLMMTNARWPDAKWSDKSVFDNRVGWSKVSESESRQGLITNVDSALADSGLDMSGALGVLNIGSWNTFVAPIDHHNPGDNAFTYTGSFGGYKENLRLGRYYIEDKLELLNASEEWFFDRTSMTLYFIPPMGYTFTTTSVIRGKVQTYNLQMKNSRFVNIKNIDFFGTTLKGEGVPDVRFDSLNFLHPCASKRMLQETEVTQCTRLIGYKGTIFNNTFTGADGIPLSYYGSSDVILENNLFQYNDWTSANSRTGDGGHSTIEAKSRGDVYRRNTLLNNGEGHGIRPGHTTNVTLNRVHGTCFGMQQNDGSGIHLTIRPQWHSQIVNNWVHDSPKYGIRFDGTPPRVGYNGNIIGNVVYRCGGIQMKGDNHTALNNLAFDELDDRFNASLLAPPQGRVRTFPRCSLCVWKYVRSNRVEINANSVVVGNLADAANGGAISRWEVRPMNGKEVRNNEVTVEIKSWMRDPDNDDFRLLPEYQSVTAGPYHDITYNYWIPGRQLYKASSPVPPHRSQSVIAANRDALMWLNAYNCPIHKVFLQIRGNGQVKFKRVGTATNGENVVYFGAKRKPTRGKTYTWRVDAYCEDGVYTGDEWVFTTI